LASGPLADPPSSAPPSAPSGAPSGPGSVDHRWNLSAAAIRHGSLTWFFLAAIALFGFGSFFQLGQREDPDFTLRLMVVRTFWPGATTAQVDRQVTDRIEKKLQEIPYFRFTRSYSKPGESLIVLELKDSAPQREVAQIWYQVRKKISDIRTSLPTDAVGPFFNDEFGDVFGTIYAFTADGMTHSELREFVDGVRQNLIRIPDVAKIELVGVVDDKIWVEPSIRKLASLGIDPGGIAAQLQAQNAVLPGGTVEGPDRSVPLRFSGQFDSVADIAALPIQIGNRTLRLDDVAKVSRGLQDPPVTNMRYKGQPAIGLAIAMVRDGDVPRLGKALDLEMARLQSQLPIGVSFAKVSDQPRIVQNAVGLFLRSLGEAVIIVLAVSFLSLGARSGLVVALTIPLVLAATFLLMKVFGIDLHRISTGALVIALGLLVDDAIIAVEMMLRKIEEGFDRFQAATFAFTSTAFPMLTGTLITAAGFLPIATAKSSTGEYTIAIFQVVSIALLVSWLAAVVATPLIGMRILRGPLGTSPATANATTGQLHHPNAMFQGRFYGALRALIDVCMRRRGWTIGITLGVFLLGGYGMGLTEKQFFPSSDRAEILIELWLPEGSSLRATEEQTQRVESFLAADSDVANFVAYVGNGSPRYYVSLDQQLFRPNFAQLVILTPDVASRDRLMPKLRQHLQDQYPGVRARAYRTPLGPPVSYPLQFRVVGPEVASLKALGEQVAGVIREDPAARDVHLDWGDRSPAVQIDIDQDRARAIGASSAGVARAIGTTVSGATIGQYREADRLIDVVLRAPEAERSNLSTLGSLPVMTASGRTVPLSQVASIQLSMEEPIIWRRSREPTLTVRGDLMEGVQAPDIASRIDRRLLKLKSSLPDGYRIELGGPAEDSARAQASINAGMPLMLFLVVALLMVQLKRISLVVLVLLTAPLGIVGVASALLLSGRPFGFVAMLGTIALAGMIMRNTVILVEQIRQDLDAGVVPWLAVRESAVRRFRPIALTAAAAVFAMIPLSRDVLWGPMAFAIMGGLIVATILTILCVPALYVAWFRISRAPDPA
jgi:multidrug efflux pump